MGDVRNHNDPKHLILSNYFRVCGGDEGIRTLERLPVTPLAGERLRPLGHVSTDAYSRANTYITRRFLSFSKLLCDGQIRQETAGNSSFRHQFWARSGQFWAAFFHENKGYKADFLVNDLEGQSYPFSTLQNHRASDVELPTGSIRNSIFLQRESNRSPLTSAGSPNAYHRSA